MEWICYETSAYIGSYEDGEPKWAGRKFYRCPECRKATAVQTNYCAHCGVKLSKYLSEPTKEGELV